MMMAKSITAFNEEEKMNKPAKMDFGVKQKKVWEMTPEEVQHCCTEGRIQEVASVGTHLEMVLSHTLLSELIRIFHVMKMETHLF